MRKGGLLLGVVVAGATLAVAMAAPVAFAQEMERVPARLSAFLPLVSPFAPGSHDI